MKKKQIEPAKIAPKENTTGAMAVIPAKPIETPVVEEEKQVSTRVSIAYFLSTTSPQFVETNTAPKPTGMKKRIIETIQEMLAEQNFKATTDSPVPEAMQNHYNQLERQAHEQGSKEKMKLVSFNAKDAIPLKITHADFMRRLGVENSNHQMKEAEIALGELASKNYLFRWPFKEITTTSKGKISVQEMIAETYVPYFFFQRVYHKNGKLAYFVFIPTEILHLGIDKPSKYVNAKKQAWIMQQHSPGAQFNEDWDGLTNALWNYILGEYQIGINAAKKKNQPFNAVRNYPVEDLLKLHIQRKRKQSMGDIESKKMELQPIKNLEPDHEFFQRDFKKNKKHHLGKLEKALNTLQRVGALVGWQYIKSGKEVQLVLPDSWPSL
jgi:hypothetical protein